MVSGSLGCSAACGPRCVPPPLPPDQHDVAPLGEQHYCGTSVLPFQAWKVCSWDMNKLCLSCKIDHRATYSPKFLSHEVAVASKDSSATSSLTGQLLRSWKFRTAILLLQLAQLVPAASQHLLLQTWHHMC